jgi:drug/metabolite transporter (DMT)-like permease
VKHENTLVGPYFRIVVAAVIWASAGPFIKYLTLPPSTVAFFRLAVPTLILVPYLRTRGISLKPSGRMLIASMFFALRMFLFTVGFTYASIGGAVVVLYTWPIFMSLLAIPMAKEHMDARSVVLLVAAFAGILLVYGEASLSLADDNFIGLSAVLLSSIILAVINLVFREELATRSVFEAVYFQNVVGAIFFLPFFLLNRPLPAPDQFIVGSVYAALVGLVSFSLFFYGLKHLRVAKAATVSYVEVVCALLFAYLFFEEAPTWNKLMGALLILGSASLVRK